MIRFVALLTAASAIYILAPNVQKSIHTLTGIVKGQYLLEYFATIGFALLANFFVPIFKLIASFGIYRLTRWARKFSIWVLLFETGLRLYVVGKFCWYNFYYLKAHPNEPMIALINVVPSLIVLVIDLFCLIFLMRSRAQLLDVELTPGARHRSL